MWSELKELDDPELKELATSLPSIVLRGRALATVKKYSGAFLRWKRWAEVSVMPGKPLNVALYMSYLIHKARTHSPVQEALNAISWAHQVACVEDPTLHPLVQNVVAGFKRILAHQTKKKEPIMPEILQALVEKFNVEGASLDDVRMLTICILGYSAFLRFDELSKIKEGDISIFSAHMEIFLESRSSRIVVARTSGACCPVSMMEKYLGLIHTESCQERYDQCVFRGLVKTKQGYRLRKSGSLSYTRVRELVLDKLESIGLDKRKFGVHNLRAGGATAAANAGVPYRLFKLHGRWKSETAKDGYVKDDLAERLTVTKNIGI